MFFSKLATIVLLSLVMMLDLTFTLVGQPESYWQDYSCCNEASPIGSFLLSIDPKIFVLSFAVYFVVVLFLTKKMENRLNFSLVVAVFLGHTWGSASWLGKISSNCFSVKISEWHLYVGYFLIIAFISGFCFGRINPKSS